MAKRDGKTITLGSGKLYAAVYDGSTLPAYTDVCKEENLLGWIKGGAELEYQQETYEEKDDLGMVSKIIVTQEVVLLRAGLLTWNGKTLTKLVERGVTYVQDGIRYTKIGGAGNTNPNALYVICFAHEDKEDGNMWVLIVGKNTAGFTISFATDAGTVVEPEFTALPQDDAGTLVQLIEQTTDPDEAAPAAEDNTF